MSDHSGAGRVAHAYLADPTAIYAASFAAIRREVDLHRWPASLQPLVLRIIHASGSPEIAADLRHEGDPADAAKRTLADGAPIATDGAMIRAGIQRSHLPQQNDVILTLDDPETRSLATRRATTRSAAAVDLWPLERSVIAIGNAPTALFRLIERIVDEGRRPAAIFAFPVGFVGAAEAKAALVDAHLGIPYLTLLGRRGGSAMAAAAINALHTPAA